MWKHSLSIYVGLKSVRNESNDVGRSKHRFQWCDVLYKNYIQWMNQMKIMHGILGSSSSSGSGNGSDAGVVEVEVEVEVEMCIWYSNSITTPKLILPCYVIDCSTIEIKSNPMYVTYNDFDGAAKDSILKNYTLEVLEKCHYCIPNDFVSLNCY